MLFHEYNLTGLVMNVLMRFLLIAAKTMTWNFTTSNALELLIQSAAEEIVLPVSDNPGKFAPTRLVSSGLQEQPDYHRLITLM
jgi:hypothetical protein